MGWWWEDGFTCEWDGDEIFYLWMGWWWDIFNLWMGWWWDFLHVNGMVMRFFTCEWDDDEMFYLWMGWWWDVYLWMGWWWDVYLWMGWWWDGFTCEWDGDEMVLPVNGKVMSPAPVRIPPTSPAHPPLRLAMLQLFLVSPRLSIIGSIPAMIIHRLSLHFKYAVLYRVRSLLNLRKASTHPGNASSLSSFTIIFFSLHVIVMVISFKNTWMYFTPVQQHGLFKRSLESNWFCKSASYWAATTELPCAVVKDYWLFRLVL